MWSPLLSRRLGSLMGKAIAYALDQWQALGVFLEDGRVEIDNNLVENAIRPTALGKNYGKVEIMRSCLFAEPECAWPLGLFW